VTLDSRACRFIRVVGVLVVVAASPCRSEGLALRFVAPPADRPLRGETRVVLEIDAPAGSRILRVDLYIDDQLVTTFERPPFEISWNAGDEFQPHLFRAVATDDAGRSATATLRTPPLRIGQRETVSLVNLFVSVLDARGRPMTELSRQDFAVYEDGVPQEITHFSAARQPLSVALLLDASNSMGTAGRIEIARKAAVEFIKKMDPENRLLVMTFSDTVRELQSLTTDRRRLEKAIQGIVAEGGTALYDALVEAASRLRDFEGRKAVVLLSDGRDQAFKENAPGSLHLFDEAVDAVVRGEVAVYAIGLGARLEDETDLSQRWTLKQILEILSRRTGGRFYNPERAGQLSGVYDQISEDLNGQYAVAYSPKNDARDGKWRTVRVEVNRPGLKTFTRPGYFAPSR